MAHLLGSKFCIESLRNDVTDLHSAITDVFSRAGPVRYPSWKYPDKTSCDLDIVDLLEVYDYSEDEEERQVAHVVLLELVIDRLVLLLQSFGRYVDQIMSAGNRAQSAASHHNTSVGLAAKKYWNKLVQIYSLVQKLSSESKSKSREITELEEKVNNMTSDLEHLQQTGCGDSGVQVSSQRKPVSISSDVFHKAAQTYETAFVPCEACAVVQINLREVGDTVSALCKSQALPCALNKYRAQIADLEWLSGNDISRWTSEQSKDLNRISKHFEHFVSTVASLEDQLKSSKEECANLMQQLEESRNTMKIEQEGAKKEYKQLQSQLKNIEERAKTELTNVERKNKNLQTEQSNLERQVDGLKKDLHFQKQSLIEMESSKDRVEKELIESQTNNAEVKRLEGEMTTVQLRLQEVESRLKETTTELAKEHAKSKSVSKHTQALQSKQDSLLQRIDELDRENEDLKNDVADLEETKETLEGRLEALAVEKKAVEKKLKDEELLIRRLKEEKESIEASIQELGDNIHRLESQLDEAKQKERLLVEYPDPNGLVNSDLTGTGDIAQDMQNQVKANQVRIRVLEEQNMTLRNSITKMMKAQADHRPEPVQQEPMWSIPTYADDGDEDRPSSNNSYDPTNHVRDQPIRIPVASSPSEKRPKTRSQQGQEMPFEPRIGPGARQAKPMNNPTPPSGIAAYRNLKKSGLLKPIEKKATSRPSSGQVQEMFSCNKCDKMYTTAQDLDIHKMYCYA